MNEHQRQLSISTTDSMKRHNLMYVISANNPDKGAPGGDCNVTQCQKPGASSYNTPMKAFYCHSCAVDINRWNEDPFVDAQLDYTLNLGDNPKNYDFDIPTEKLNKDGTSAIEISQEKRKPRSASQYGFGSEYPYVRDEPKQRRNSICKCGSNLKFKKCCIDKIW